ncbi:MAG: ABC transporter permease [Dehalococcoidia bacterium]|nr:ABC transporter permease [Dehalococcoidia bacterium]
MIEQLKKVWQKRELLWYIVKLQMKAEKKNKALGFLWSFLDPLLLFFTYYILVHVIFGRGGPQFPVLLFIALLSWRWFTSYLTRSVTCITSKAGLIQSVRFPLAILPLSGIIIGFFDWLFGFVILVPMLFIFEASFTVNILWLPVLLLIEFVGIVGACLLFAVVGTYLSDLSNILQFLIRLGFYLSPILYSVQDIIESERLTMLYMLGNPFAGLMESYKNVVVLGAPPNEYALVGTAVACVVFLIGLWYFSRDEYKLVKSI